MAHPRPRLNEYGRQTIVRRVLEEGRSVGEATAAMNVSRSTGYKWLRRYAAEGEAGLADRSSRPHHSPRATPPAEIERIVAARRATRYGALRLSAELRLPASTVGAVLRREGLPHLADLDRPTGQPVRRYEACHPGALLHQDHKRLGRIPAGGGHRVLGRAAAPPGHRGSGHDHVEVLIDDRSRRSVVVVVPDGSATSAANALELALADFAAAGISVERVMTDNGWAYRSDAYRAALAGRTHSRTRPYRPQTNGKAERFIGTLLAEWAYARPYRTNDERLAALPRFVDFYNRQRPHTALGGLTPMAVVNNVHGHHS